MRHYEIVLMIHPDQSEQVSGMIKRYTDIVTKNSGKIHRQEDWGRHQLAYSIQKVHKAHYVLLNIECNQETHQQLHESFRFNDAIMRELMIRCDEAITEPSAIMNTINEEKAQENG